MNRLQVAGYVLNITLAVLAAVLLIKVLLMPNTLEAQYNERRQINVCMCICDDDTAVPQDPEFLLPENTDPNDQPM
jgi:hypothetical protein